MTRYMIVLCALAVAGGTPAALAQTMPQTTAPVLYSVTSGTNSLIGLAIRTGDFSTGASVAAGSIVSIYTFGAGPDRLLSAPSLPLATSLPNNAAGSSVQFIRAGVTYNAPMLYTSSTQLGAIVPSNVPPGPATATVTYGGAVSNAVPVNIVATSFGIFTQNSQGYGPASAQNYVSSSVSTVNALTTPAQPGQIVTLYGTGLGAALDGNDSGAPKVGNIGMDVAVTVGNITMKPLYAGRSPQYPGLDQINFQLPAAGQFGMGCYVPVAVTTGGVAGNSGTIAVSTSSTCDHPLGLSTAQLSALDAGQSINLGTLTLIRQNSPITPSPQVSDTATASFQRLNANGVYSVATSVGRAGLNPLPGTCLVSNFTLTLALAGFSSFAPGPTILDAGPSLMLLSFVHPTPVILQQSSSGYETASGSDGNSPPFLNSGPWTLAAPGGTGLRAFNANFLIPAVPLWTNAVQATSSAISRANPWTVNWTGGGPNDVMQIGGTSTIYPANDFGGSGAQFVCAAPASAGTFTVPASILSMMQTPPRDPQTGQYSATVALSLNSRLGGFTAPLASGGSLDAGVIFLNYNDIRFVAWQ